MRVKNNKKLKTKLKSVENKFENVDRQINLKGESRKAISEGSEGELFMTELHMTMKIFSRLSQVNR